MSQTATVTVYLVLERKAGWRTRARVVRHSVNKPTLAKGQCAVMVAIAVPVEAFEPILAAPDLVFTVENTLRAKAEVAPKRMVVLGSGPLADAMRALTSIAVALGDVVANARRFRPETWSIKPHAVCPCCGEEIFRCTTRHTGWVEGFATHSNKVHPTVDPKTREPAPDGVPTCCCVAPNWGPKHTQKSRPTRARRRK